jgi:hypothetical protein
MLPNKLLNVLAHGLVIVRGIMGRVAMVAQILEVKD